VAAWLLGLEGDDLEQVGDEVDVAAVIARQYGACVSHQGFVHDGEFGWLVPFGHSGVGTSGSGDVLAGAVAGLLARGSDRAQATCWATYLHAAASDRPAQSWAGSASLSWSWSTRCLGCSPSCRSDRPAQHRLGGQLPRRTRTQR
jgi:NAD(P)H-hydrate repair Nnr-like enzyme with NAD(P)H-hydrate dehydratase domain